MNFNTIHRLVCIAVSVLPLVFSSCEDEPKVGSPLFPEDDNASVVRAYIDNHCFYPKNFMQSHLIQTGVGGALNLEDNTVSLSVQLTAAATKDLTFSLVVNPSDIEPEDEKTVVLSEDAIVFQPQTVIVHKGELMSRERISFTLNKDSESLKKFASEGLLSFSLVSRDGVDMVPGYDSYMWKVTKEVTNINADGNLQGNTKLPFAEYDVMKSSFGELEVTDDLSDDDVESTYVLLYSKTEGCDEIAVQFHEEQSVAGISITPFSYMSSWALSCSQLELLGGEDKDHLERIGIATCPKTQLTDYTPWEVVFFSPVKMKYLVIRVMDNYSGGSSKNIIVPEIRIYT